MLDNINASTPTSSAPQPDKKAQSQEKVKKEQEDFSRLIEEKSAQAEKKPKAESKGEGEGKGEASLAAAQNATQSTSKEAVADKLSESKDKLASKATSPQESKTLNDVKKLADEKELNAQNIALKQEGGADSTPKNQNPIGTKELLEKQASQNVVKNSPPVPEPLAQALREISAKEAQNRREEKASQMQYKIEKSTEKIAVIGRGKNLPKNIVEARMRNERREMAYDNALAKFGVKSTGEDNSLMQEALNLDEKKKSLDAQAKPL